jgi:hypothetical protein
MQSCRLTLIVIQRYIIVQCICDLHGDWLRIYKRLSMSCTLAASDIEKLSVGDITSSMHGCPTKLSVTVRALAFVY